MCEIPSLQLIELPLFACEGVPLCMPPLLECFPYSYLDKSEVSSILDYEIVVKISVVFKVILECSEWLLKYKLSLTVRPLFQRGNMRRALWATQEMNSIGKVFCTSGAVIFNAGYKGGRFFETNGKFT